MRELMVTIALAGALSGCALGTAGGGRPASAEAEVRDAERALESDDPIAWVHMYTEDALFVAPNAPAAQGRAALLKMARTMKPLSSVLINAVRTEVSGPLAAVYGHASWVSGRPPAAGSASRVRFLIVWRKEADGQWRIAQELLSVEPPQGK